MIIWIWNTGWLNPGDVLEKAHGDENSAAALSLYNGDEVSSVWPSR